MLGSNRVSRGHKAATLVISRAGSVGLANRRISRFDGRIARPCVLERSIQMLDRSGGPSDQLHYNEMGNKPSAAAEFQKGE